MTKYSIGVEEYQTPKGNKGHAIVIRKHSSETDERGEWLDGFGKDKALDYALLFEQKGPEAVAAAFKAGALKLAELDQAKARRSATPSKLLTPLG